MTQSNPSSMTRLAIGKRRFLTVVLASAISSASLVIVNSAYGHDEGEEMQATHAMPMPNMHDDDHGPGAMHDDHEDAGHGHGHAHSRWVDPPQKYASRENPDWNDEAATKRGRKIFETNCVVCHGEDGRGTGPAASGLSHKPADLTNHFHRGPGLGDGYLFWRVSEGGTVEPFHSLGSAMPAFKTVLSERQRWDVLTYVHQLFHKTFKSARVHDDDEHAGAHVDEHMGDH